MNLKLLPMEFAVCQLDAAGQTEIDKAAPYYFIGRTDEELSLVCPADQCPGRVLNRRDGWLCLKIAGPLDFSLVGVLAKIANCLAERRVPIFAVSTYNTDYVLFEKQYRETALKALAEAGNEIETE